MIEFIKKNYSKLGMGLSLIMLIISFFQQRELSKLRAEQKFSVDSLNNLGDSLRSEIFVREMQVARYEIGLELFKEQNKKAGDEFQLILSTQTE